MAHSPLAKRCAARHLSRTLSPSNDAAMPGLDSVLTRDSTRNSQGRDSERSSHHEAGVQEEADHQKNQAAIKLQRFFRLHAQ
eukprot:6269056-Prymnesium_polylepis.1